jgi:hypothetical protein
MTDHDQQTRGGGHSSYDAAKSPAGDGEAVGVVLRSGIAATPRLCGFAADQFRLFGQVFSWVCCYSDATIW